MLLGDSVHAGENMTFHGILVKAPDCHINSDKTIEVPFGNVGVNKVDGIHYSRRIDYKVTCDGQSDEHLYLSVDGTGVNWNTAAVKTSSDGMAIEIRQNGEPFTLGSKVGIDINDQPSLTAVPIKGGDQLLASGDFTASATLIAFYQ